MTIVTNFLHYVSVGRARVGNPCHEKRKEKREYSKGKGAWCMA
ncbi:MAG TPA: hypothetical protein VJ373_05090 [Desulfatiglandales bacterium]|nr:hypothetical protein [Desulfatiglandales bacterium]